MKITTTLALMLAFVALPALAGWADQAEIEGDMEEAERAYEDGMAYEIPPFSEADVHKVTALMLQGYREAGINGMLQVESVFFDGVADAARQRNAAATEKLLLYVVTATITGAIIEAAQARKEIRGMSPLYGAERMKARIDGRLSEHLDFLSEIGFDENMQRNPPIKNLAEEIIIGLHAAGMR
jgi:hypothetical protein